MHGLKAISAAFWVCEFNFREFTLSLIRMVYMNTKNNVNNERLRELVTGAGLTQPAALALFNRGIKVRPLSESAWKSYFCTPGTARHRRFTDELLIHAEKVFSSLRKDA